MNSNPQPTHSQQPIIVGVDEAGRGPLAGPVTAACVVLPDGFHHPLIRDSKKLSPLARQQIYDIIITNALAYSVVAVGHFRIDSINIRQATRLAMHLAAKRLEKACKRSNACISCHSSQLTPTHRFHYLIDGNMTFDAERSQEPIIKGDSKVACISAASIIAKVTRDRLMETLDRKYANYGFAKHKGYPTADHLERITTFGPSPVHRLTFRGVKEHVHNICNKSSNNLPCK